MLNVIVGEIKPQVKLSNQEMLAQQLTKLVANKSTKQEITIGGQKFSLVFKQGAGGNRDHYVIRTMKKELLSVPVGGKRQAELLHSLGKKVPMEMKPFIKPIESGAVLEIELSISSRNNNGVAMVAGWSGEIGEYVAKVAKELGW